MNKHIKIWYYEVFLSYQEPCCSCIESKALRSYVYYLQLQNQLVHYYWLMWELQESSDKEKQMEAGNTQLLKVPVLLMAISY